MEKTLNELLEDHYKAKSKLQFFKERRELAQQEVMNMDRRISTLVESIEDISIKIENLNK